MKFRQFRVALFGSLLLCSSAAATDLDALVRVLIPAFMAQNFAAVCLAKNSRFLAELKDGPAAVSAFADRVKQRVTAGLSESEAEKVRVTAADTARQVASHELERLNRQQIGSDSSLETWCDRSAKPFVLEALRRHEENRQEFNKILEDAKR
jgi:hypothetical protein